MYNFFFFFKDVLCSVSRREVITVTFFLNFLWLCFVPCIWSQRMYYNKETLVQSGKTFNLLFLKMKRVVRSESSNGLFAEVE